MSESDPLWLRCIVNISFLLIMCIILFNRYIKKIEAYSDIEAAIISVVTFLTLSVYYFSLGELSKKFEVIVYLITSIGMFIYSIYKYKSKRKKDAEGTKQKENGE